MPDDDKSACARCGMDVCRPCVPIGRPVPANDNVGVIWAAPDRRLLNKAYVVSLAVYVAALGLSRREIGNWLAETIFAYFESGGTILAQDGTPYVISDSAIDDAFNNDGSWRWMGCFLRWAACTPKQRPQGRTLTRLRLIDLAVRIDKASHAER